MDRTPRRTRLRSVTPFLVGSLLLSSSMVVGCGDRPVPPRVDEAQADGEASGSIRSGVFDLQYRIEGAGRPAIVIGFPAYYTRAFSQSLRSHLRMVFVDHRGSAASPGPVERAEFSLDRLAADVELIRETLDLGSVIVIGHSGHAFMALEYAKRYPSNVSHVVMIGVAPDLSETSVQLAGENWEKLASAERKTALEENRLNTPDEELAKLPPGEAWIKTYVRDGPRAWYDPHFDSTPLWDGVDVNMDMFNYVWGELFRDIDVTQGLDPFTRPVLLALGRYDFLVAPPSSWDPVLDRFEDVTVRVFENSGHTPQFEEPGLFDRELLAWIEAHE